LAVAVLLGGAGCATLKQEAIIKGDKEEKIGTVVIWSADKNAAVVVGDKTCIQNALSVGSIDTGGGGTATAKLDSSGVSGKPSGNANAAGAGRYRSEVQRLMEPTERVTFLVNGFYYLCQLAANSSLTKEQTTQLVNTLLLAASDMKKWPQDVVAPGIGTVIIKPNNSENSGRGEDGTNIQLITYQSQETTDARANRSEESRSSHSELSRVKQE
jgi:hypothetical protein